ncbi:MAG TPA: YvrJ family protein [Candidatus Cryosericum sp.]|nr:YvrJ family protein [Candidatus Cryosericum sp.]HPS70101.1 YvrJ family protein [Candidatus Cryosericum sp.]
MDELVSLVGNIGFPIAVSVYLLTVFGAKLDHMQASLDRLSDVIEAALRMNGTAVTP